MYRIIAVGCTLPEAPEGSGVKGQFLLIAVVEDVFTVSLAYQLEPKIYGLTA